MRKFGIPIIHSEFGVTEFEVRVKTPFKKASLAMFTMDHGVSL